MLWLFRRLLSRLGAPAAPTAAPARVAVAGRCLGRVAVAGAALGRVGAAGSAHAGGRVSVSGRVGG